jgi:hypothetical protein
MVNLCGNDWELSCNKPKACIRPDAGLLFLFKGWIFTHCFLAFRTEHHRYFPIVIPGLTRNPGLYQLHKKMDAGSRPA